MQLNYEKYVSENDFIFEQINLLKLQRRMYDPRNI